MVAFTGILFNLLSITLGASIPGFLISDNAGTASDVRLLLTYEAGIVTIPYILLAIFFKDKPKQAPSKSADAIANQ